MSDYYSLLGVSRDSSEDQIKRAYRRLAMELHPDRNGGDPQAEEKFKLVTEAYEVLRDPEKRSVYDRYGEAGLKAGAGFSYHHFDLSEALSVFMRDFGGLGGFESIFGTQGSRQRSRRQGQDIRVNLRLSLTDVANGVTRKLKLQRLDPCDLCGGSGAKEGTSPKTCQTCGGAGEVRRATQSFFGSFVQVSACPACDGQGKVIDEVCEQCRGDGRFRQERVIDVEIPAGISESNYLTMRGQGQAGPRGGPAGDLIVGIEVKPDKRFERRGDDLIYDLAVSFSQAALGATFQVPTPYGETEVEVPEGTQPGTVITVREMGLPNLSNGLKGSLRVRVYVWTPTNLNKEQIEVFERLAEVEGDPPSPESIGRRFWNRMKEVLGA